MNKNIGIVVGIIVIAGIGYFAFSGEKMEKKVMEEQKIVEEKGAMMEAYEAKVDSMMKKDETSMVEQKIEKSDAMMKGSYESYSAEKIARAATGDVVIFFHAAWCPSCRGLSADIEKNMSAIPAGVTILKADYDSETALKKKYGVTSQHTLVQVDKDGNLIKKWSGGSKLTNLLSQIQ